MTTHAISNPSRARITRLQLVGDLVTRELGERFAGTYLGWFWVLLPQVLTLLIFAFVFGVVFEARWGQDYGDGFARFAVILFAGLILFNFVAECLNRGPRLILDRPNLVKQVVFPLELLPVVAALAAAVTLVASIAVLLPGAWLVGIPIRATALALPLLLIPLILAGCGLLWWLSAIGIYLRDVAQATTPLTQILLFLSPIFYPLSALPEPYQPWFYLNPLTVVVQWSRGLLFEGTMPGLWPLLGYWLATGLFALGGLLWFRRLRKGFADVL